VVAADFDRDGDLDLFLGARSVPGRYPEMPESALLRNESSGTGEVRFSDATDSGPVRLFHNRAGKLEETTKSAGLAGRNGWWNGVTAGDFDGDGDTDYAALNVGFNTKYGHPTAAKPAVLYLGDMDKNGVPDLVEAKVTPDGELPVRGRSCSSTAMPFIKKKFESYRAFASANLAGIYTDQELGRSIRVSADEFASGLLINESKPGNPRFSWQPLPEQAQISPGFGAVAADFFGDGRPALAIAQNLFSREPETGLWRGGLGCLLRGSDKTRELTALDHAGTGFIIDGDGKALALADLNADGLPDLVGTQNNGALLAFANQSVDRDRRFLTIRLDGLPGNPSAVGARVSVKGGESSGVSSHEVSAGSGYLGQSTPTVFFVAAKQAKSLAIRIDWPDGATSETRVDPTSTMIPVEHPKTRRTSQNRPAGSDKSAAGE
jgi:hypothetical protein